MQIQRVQTGSENTNAAGQVQRGARGHHHKHVDPTAVDTDSTDTDAIDAVTKNTGTNDTGTTDKVTTGLDALVGLTAGATQPAADSTETTAPTSDKKLHPRLAAYAQKIENRLAHAAANPDLSPRQQAAIQQAQTQFHSLIQRLDDAHTSGSPMDQKKPMIDSLTAMIDHLVQNVNHIQSGGPLDIRG